MISRGCLKASGNRNYWGIDNGTLETAELRKVLEDAVNPRHPPDVSGFSNYKYVPESGTFGLFITPGLDDELSFGRCRPHAAFPMAVKPRRARNCTVLETIETETKEADADVADADVADAADADGVSEVGLAACRQRALRSGANTVAVDAGRCELLRCNPAAAVALAALHEHEREVFSKHCSEIRYATMPENLTYQGGSGLVIPKPRGTRECSNVSSDWLQKGEDPPACWEHSEGWRLISELIDPKKPYMRQANTQKHIRTLPPLKDLSAFDTHFWEPVATALSQGIPSQYPNSPIPQYAEIEPRAELLLRST